MKIGNVKIKNIIRSALLAFHPLPGFVGERNIAFLGPENETTA